MWNVLTLMALQAAAPQTVALDAGAAPQALGLTRDDEASPEGPGSLAVDRDGRFWILDAVHRRVAVLAKDGALEGSVPLPSDTIEDLALLPSGDVAVLDRTVMRRVFVLAANGTILADAPIEGAGIDEGGEITAIFADAAGVWLEVLRGLQVRVLDEHLRADARRTVRHGLPQGDRTVRLRKVGDAAQVLFFDATGLLVADTSVSFSSLLQLSGLVASEGALWIAGHELVQAAPGARPTRDAIVIVRLERNARGAWVERARTSVKASPEFVPLKQLVPAGDGVAHLWVDTTAPRGARRVEVTSW